jgi:DNA-binding XRE family transcriptional regulator
MASLHGVRREKGLSQRALADKTGVRLETIYLIESGRRHASLQVMRLICAVLDVDPIEIDEFQASVEQPPTKR